MHFSTKSNQSNLIPEYFSVCCAFFFSYCCLSHSHSRNTGTCFPSLWKLGREHSSVSKQALKGLEQNTEGFRVVEQKQYLCLLPLLFPGKKKWTKCIPELDSQTWAEWYQNKCESPLGHLQEECLLETDMLTIAMVHSGRIYPNLSRFTFCICFQSTKASTLYKSDIASKHEEGWRSEQVILKSQAGSEERKTIHSC